MSKRSANRIPAASPPARFTSVVEQCGRPTVHLTLRNPARDPALQKLERQSRVMTLHHAGHGGGADHGEVGIRTGPGRQLIVFPRSLRRFAKRRIVGIRYDLLDENLRITAPGAAPARKRRRAMTRQPKPVRRAAAPPKPESTPAPAPPAQSLPPLTLPEVLRDLRRIEHLLRRRRIASARENIEVLVRDIEEDLAARKG
jgi:hypothetical protein